MCTRKECALQLCSEDTDHSNADWSVAERVEVTALRESKRLDGVAV